MSNVHQDVLLALDNTALITVNESWEEPSRGEFRVQYVQESPFEVSVRGYNGNHYQIELSDSGTPHLYEVTEDGASHETQIHSIELIGTVDE